MNKKQLCFALKSILCLAAAACMLPLSSGCAPARLSTPVINEVVSSNSRSLTDPKLGSPDWVEILNPTDKPIDLKGYRLTDKLGSSRGILPEAQVPAGGALVVCVEKGGAAKGSKALCVDFNLPREGESLYLVDPKNTVVCQAEVPALLADESWARRADGEYGFCMLPTPGKPNADAGIFSSDALDAKLKAEKPVLNEALPKGSAGESWVELYDPGKADVDLAYYCLTDDPSDPQKYRLPEGTLGAGKYLVVKLGGSATDGGLSAPFSLGKADSAVYLYDVTGKLADCLRWQQRPPEGVSAVRGGAYTAFPTPGAANSKKTFASPEPAAMDPKDPVRLSEALPRNQYGLADASGQRTEWVELRNTGGNAVSLSGYFLSDNSGDLFKWAFPDTKIEAGGYLVVFLSGAPGKAGELHASFELGEGEKALYLTDGSALRLDTLALPASISRDISVGRADDGSPLYYRTPTPGAANGAGTADLGSIGPYDAHGVYISEVCSVNPAKSGKKDWIELHNGGSAAANLAGYYLSDDASNPKMWKIPALSIPAGGYAVVYATSDTFGRDENTAPFGISPSGETLLLSDTGGFLVDAFESGELSPGVTSGRAEGGEASGRVFFTSPTPGQPNPAQYAKGYAPEPVFSDAQLFHTQPFSLSISAEAPGVKITYTTDGSTPTAASKPYSGPITVSANTAVRAVAFADGMLPSPVATQTYLFDAPHTLPVFCVSGDPKEMHVLITTDKRDYKPEYDSFVEYYEADGSFAVAFPSGIRPKGRSSLTNAQNSLVLRLRGSYGQGGVTYPFFPGNPVSSYTTLALRDSGQDNPKARIRDSFFQTVAQGLDLDTIRTRLVVLYINGQYCGLYDLDEEQNADYAASHYNLQKGNVDLIDRNGTVMAGDNEEFLRVSSLAQTMNTADDAQFAEFSKLVDTDACTDYLVTQIYFGDGDVLNNRFWRARDYSVKWRPLLYDLDWCLRFNDANRNEFYRYFTPHPVAGNGSVTNMYIFCALKKNKAWCDKFVERYVQLAETQFSPDRILGIYDGMVRQMTPEMPLDIARWRDPGSMAAWQQQTSDLRDALVRRQAIALRQLQQYFHVPQATMDELIEKYKPAQ